MRGAVDHRDALAPVGERLDEDLCIVRIIGEHRLIARRILVERDDVRVAEDRELVGRQLAQVVADDQRRVEHRP